MEKIQELSGIDWKEIFKKGDKISKEKVLDFWNYTFQKDKALG